MFIKYCVFFRTFKNIPNSVFPRCQCVYTHQAGGAAKLAEFRKITTFEGKNTIFNEHPVDAYYVIKELVLDAEHNYN